MWRGPWERGGELGGLQRRRGAAPHAAGSAAAPPCGAMQPAGCCPHAALLLPSCLLPHNTCAARAAGSPGSRTAGQGREGSFTHEKGRWYRAAAASVEARACCPVVAAKKEKPRLAGSWEKRTVYAVECTCKVHDAGARGKVQAMWRGCAGRWPRPAQSRASSAAQLVTVAQQQQPQQPSWWQQHAQQQQPQQPSWKTRLLCMSSTPAGIAGSLPFNSAPR